MVKIYINEIVLDTLHKYKETRDDDKLLILTIWKKQGLNLDNMNIKNLLSASTITRQRRYIQNELNKYKPTVITEHERDFKFEKMKNIIKTRSPNKRNHNLGLNYIPNM